MLKWIEDLAMWVHVAKYDKKWYDKPKEKNYGREKTGEHTIYRT